MVRVRIKESKTDPFRKGTSYAQLQQFQPSFLVVRGVEAGPFFHFASGAPFSRELLGGCEKLLSRGGLMRNIRDIASVLGLLLQLQLQE